MPRHLKSLFLNHADAYCLSMIIAGSCLALHDALSGTHLLIVLALGLAYGWGFALNDYYDAPIDALEEKKARRNFFVENPIGKPRILAISLLLLMPIGLLFASFGWRGILSFGLGIGAVWAYSAPPLRLKSRAGLDLWAHMLFVQSFPYAMLLFLLDLPLLPIDGLLLLFFLLGSLTAQLEQQIRDYAIDCQAESNFTVRFGVKTSARLLRALTLCFVLIVCAAVLMQWLPLWLIPYTLIGLPILLHRFWRHWQAPRSETLVQLTLVCTLLYTGLLWGIRLFV